MRDREVAGSGGQERDAVALLAAALPVAANTLATLDAAGTKVRERHLADALGKAMPNSVVERHLDIPGWDPQPGNVDLFGRDRDGPVRWAVETKLKASNDLYECLWDMAKMLWLATSDGIEDVFIVAGTTKRNWDKPIDCTNLFTEGRHVLVGEIERLRHWWIKYILGDSAGRPSAVPPFVDVEPVATAHVTLASVEWEIRAISVAAFPPTTADWIPFQGGLPARGA